MSMMRKGGNKDREKESGKELKRKMKHWREKVRDKEERGIKREKRRKMERE